MEAHLMSRLATLTYVETVMQDGTGKKEKVGSADLNGNSHNLKVCKADLCGNTRRKMVLEHKASHPGHREMLATPT